MTHKNTNLEEMIGNKSKVESVVTFLGGNYKKWGKYLSDFKEDPHNLGFIQKVLKEGHQEQGFEGDQSDALIPEKTAGIQNFIDGMQGIYGQTILDYAKDNVGKILNLSSPNILYKNARSMKPYSINDKEHDSIVKIYKKFLEAYALLSSDSEELMENYIKETMLKKAFLPVFLQTKDYDKEYLSRLMANITKSREYELKKKFGKDGELNKSKLISYINSNLSKSNDKEKDSFYMNSAISLYDQISLDSKH